jgi:hypothetical protein
MDKITRRGFVGVTTAAVPFGGIHVDVARFIVR